METVEMATKIEAPAARVWQLCADFANIRLVRGFVERVEASGTGVGATRTYHLKSEIGGSYVVERLDRLDDRDRIMEYSIVDNGALPWTGYHGFIQVTPAGPDACMIVIRSKFIPVGIEPADLIKISRSNISGYFDALREAEGSPD